VYPNIFDFFAYFFSSLDDSEADLKIYGKTDDFMFLLMKELGLTIPRKTVQGITLPEFKEPNIEEEYAQRNEKKGKKIGLFGNQAAKRVLFIVILSFNFLFFSLSL